MKFQGNTKKIFFKNLHNMYMCHNCQFVQGKANDVHTTVCGLFGRVCVCVSSNFIFKASLLMKTTKSSLCCWFLQTWFQVLQSKPKWLLSGL